MLDRILNIGNLWGKILHGKEFENKLEFLNRTKAQYDWESYDLEEDEGLVEVETPVFA